MNSNSFHQDLGQVFDLTELAEIVKNFVESTTDGKPIINLDKLYLIHKLVSSDLFLQEESRAALLPTINSNISKHLKSNSNDEIAESISIILAMLDILSNKIKDKTDTMKSLLGLLPALILTITQLKKSLVQTSITNDALTALFGIFYLLEQSELEEFFSYDPSDTEKVLILSQMASFLKDLLSSRSYPENWFALILFQYNAVRHVLFAIGTNLLSNLPTPESSENEKNLFNSFITSCFNFIKSNALAFETFNETKRTMLKETTGDMRIELLNFYQEFWMALDSSTKNQLASTVVDSVIMLMLSPNTHIKTTGSRFIFQKFILCFQSLTQLQFPKTPI